MKQPKNSKSTKFTYKKVKAPLGASLIVLSSFFYASYGIWTRLMGNFFDGYTATVFRSSLVVIILALVAAQLHGFEPVKLRRNWRWIVGMLVASSFTWGTLYYSILHAGVGLSLSIAYASTVIGMFIFGKLFDDEKFTKDKALATVIGMVGLALVFSPTVHHFGVYALVSAAVSGLSSAANGVFAKRISYQATQSALALWITGIISNLVIAIALGEPWPDFGWHVQWLYLGIFALFSVAASWTFISGLKLVEAGAAGILGLLEIVFGVLFGVIFFHERPGGLVLLGVVVIMGSAAVPYVQEHRRR